jgi:peptidoglycan hydrolase-like protein with peptidoglycan-binding domain
MKAFSLILFIFGVMLFVQAEDTVAQTAAFYRNLTIGDTGADVLSLQKVLNSDTYTKIASSGPGSPGFETNYFGSLTKNAVIRYQEFYKSVILTPVGLKTGTGYVGEMTRNHLGQQAVAIPPTPAPKASEYSSDPKITNVYPTHAVAGTEVTLYGSGFAPTNTVYASFNRLDNIPSYDGKTIKFIVKEPFPADLEVPQFIREQYKSMQYGFYIGNAYGSSNTVMFTLDLVKQ